MSAADIAILENETESLGALLRGPVRRVIESWLLDVQRREPVEDTAEHDYTTTVRPNRTLIFFSFFYPSSFLQYEVSCHEHKVHYIGRSWSWSCDGNNLGDGCKRRGQYNKCRRYRCDDGCDFDLCDSCMREFSKEPATLTLSELALVEADLHARKQEKKQIEIEKKQIEIECSRF